jgi:uncharacterized hydrophobic protein (TIGR00271 family)
MKPSRKQLRFFIKLKKYFDLNADSDKENTIVSIKSAVPVNGANIWYLICSALLASIGLDVNSPAIIIGAMLISPLMSPILGIGLGFGIHDKETIGISIREFTIAVVISLITSTIYFLISPLSAATSEVLARTKPTILDVGVAFFGGIAGIVAGSRSRAANAIPGVAIATALMPPICTAGFGLSHGNLNIFFGAIYLFFINAVFISLSVYLIVRLLKFPLKEYPTRSTQRKMRQIVSTIIALITIPSVIIFYGIIMEVRTNARISNFINTKIASDSVNVIRWSYLEKGDSVTVKILIAGKHLENEKIDSLVKLLPESDLDNISLNIVQVGVVDEQNIREEHIRNFELAKLNEKVEKHSEKIEILEGQVIYYTADSVRFSKATAELKTLFPEINNITFQKGLTRSRNDSAITGTLPVFTIEWKGNTQANTKRDNLPRIYSYIKNQFSADSIVIDSR